MNYPDDLKYTKEHEWVRAESGTKVVVGITEYAADELGDVVFVELPDVGAEVTAMACSARSSRSRPSASSTPR